MGCDGLGGVAATMECPTSLNITGSGLQCRDHESRPDRAEGNLFVHASLQAASVFRGRGTNSLKFAWWDKNWEPIRLNLGGTLKVLTTNLYIYWSQRQGSLGL